MTRNFMELLRARWAENKFVCVGLDIPRQKIPEWFVRSFRSEEEGPVLDYIKHIVDATKDLVCAYKPNAAFYEAMGAPGITTLQKTCEYIREVAPGVPIIVDAKRGDIGSSSEAYVEFLFEVLGADAVTLPPYLGQEGLEPFLAVEDKGVFILCRTSNEGAREFQDLTVEINEEQFAEIIAGVSIDEESFVIQKRMPLWQYVAYRVTFARNWKKSRQRGLVAGATYPEELAEIRKISPDLPLLIPGVGAQGAKAEDVVPVAVDANGQGFIINSSRGIVFASAGKDFAQAAAQATITLSDEINQHRLVAA